MCVEDVWLECAKEFSAHPLSKQTCNNNANNNNPTSNYIHFTAELKTKIKSLTHTHVAVYLVDTISVAEIQMYVF